MAQSYRSTTGRCPYDVLPQAMVECPRFTPAVAFDRTDGVISSCAHLRCAIERTATDDGGPGMFYLRCALRTGDMEAERDFVVPLD